MKFTTLFICAAMLAVGTVSAQKMKVKGDLDQLKKADELHVEFLYENMSVGKYEDESKYLSERVAERNEDEPGSGDEWKAAWKADREKRYEPKFMELFNKYLEKDGLNATMAKESAPVNVLVHTVFTEPGFNVGVMRKPASINVEISFTNTETDEKFATMTVEKVPGRSSGGFDFDTAERIEEAYAKLGKEVGKYIHKKVF